MKTQISRSLLVKYDERVVGEVLWQAGHWVYRHFKFGMRVSSGLPTKEELLPNIDGFLRKLYEMRP